MFDLVCFRYKTFVRAIESYFNIGDLYSTFIEESWVEDADMVVVFEMNENFILTKMEELVSSVPPDQNVN